MKSILDEIGVEVSKPRVYSLTYEKLEENTDYSQTDPNGNAPHQWTKEDAAYAIVFKGTIDTLPITDKVEIEKINLEYVPVLKNVEKGEYELKPMFVCMARQNIEHSTDKEDNGLIGDSSIFPIIFDAQTGMEIQIGGTY